MFYKLIRKTAALIAIFVMFFSGIDPATFIYLIYKNQQQGGGLDSYVNGPRKAVAAVNPAEKEYTLDVGPVTGSTAANYVYASFFNPAGSGRTVSIKRIALRSHTIGTASNYVNLTVRRITSSTGGTQILASQYVQKNASSSASIMEVRSTGPTVAFDGTVDSRILGVPLSGAIGSYYSRRDLAFNTSDEKIILQPGEGIAVYQEAAGTVNSRILVLVEWDEIANPPTALNEFVFAFPRMEVNATINYDYNSFFNPIGSGKTAIVKRIWFGTETCDAAAVYTNNMSIQRITSASGGTQVLAINVPKKNTLSPDSAMDFRHTNPTVTLYAGADARIGTVTPCGSAGDGGGWSEITFHENDEKLILKEGEGIALVSETAGDPDQLTRMIIEWSEVDTVNTPAPQNGFIWSSSRVESASAANTTRYSFFNPIGSGKVAVIKRLAIRIDADTTATYINFAFRRITASSGGTLIASSNIPQKNTASASSTMEIRWCGASCASAITATYAGTVDSNMFSVISPGAIAQTIGDREIVFGGNEDIVLQEGEGLGLYSDSASDVDDYVKMTIEWSEENAAPASQGEYLIDIGPVPGNTGTSYNYATFFNPAASGKTAVIKRLQLRVDTAGAAVYIPMQIRRISAASAGTQIIAANIPKKHSGTANSVMEIRRTGVTATYSGTTDSKLMGVLTPGAVASVASGNTGYKEMDFTNKEKIVLQPGEGIGLYHDTLAGNANLRIKLLIEWGETTVTPTALNEYLLTTGPVAQSLTSGYVYSTLFNPVGSLKNIIVKKIAIRANRTGAATNPVYNPVAVRKISSVSGGTAILAANVPKKNSGTANTSADIRTTNPTVSFQGATASRVLGVTSPGVVNQEHGLYESSIYLGDELILKEGEGLALYQEVAQGDANVTYRFLTEWEEASNTSLPQSISFSVSTSTIYFGTLSSVQARFASSTNLGGDSIETQAHTFAVSTNAISGYSVTVQGDTLTSGLYSIDAIGGVGTTSSPGVEQFGLRAVATGGSGTVSSPYNGAGFAYAGTATTSSQIAGAIEGDGVTTTYSVRYIANIAGTTEAADYTAALVYVATANF